MQVDVVIVGGGIAGLAAAFELRALGRLTEALGIRTDRDYGLDVTGPARLVVRQAPRPVPGVEVTPRIGINVCVDWPLRFVEPGSRFLSR